MGSVLLCIKNMCTQSRLGKAGCAPIYRSFSMALYQEASGLILIPAVIPPPIDSCHIQQQASTLSHDIVSISFIREKQIHWQTKKK
jgi:hypothetical protein